MLTLLIWPPSGAVPLYVKFANWLENRKMNPFQGPALLLVMWNVALLRRVSAPLGSNTSSSAGLGLLVPVKVMLPATTIPHARYNASRYGCTRGKVASNGYVHLKVVDGTRVATRCPLRRDTTIR